VIFGAATNVPFAATNLDKAAVHKILNSPTKGNAADPEWLKWSPTLRSPSKISLARTVSTRE
jgi:hypothetical protein